MTRRSLIGSIGAAGMFPSFASAITAQVPDRLRPALEIGLRIGEPQSAAAGWRHAVIQGGVVAGSLLQGSVQSGRLEWLVDPASGAVEVATHLQILCRDGTTVELRDRTVHSGSDGLSGMPGLCTAPRLFREAGNSPAQVLAGRLDASGLARGFVLLRGFEQR